MNHIITPAEAIQILLDSTHKIGIPAYKKAMTTYLTDHACELGPKIRISTRNGKLWADKIAVFDIPAIATCEMAMACILYCYAQQSNYLWDDKLRSMIENYIATRDRNFVAMFIAAAAKLPKATKYIRIHSSGDAYSQEYLDTLCQVARALPQYGFYAYTKAMHLDWSEWNALGNTVPPIHSIGGRLPVDTSKRHSRIFASVEDLEAEGYVDTHKSDLAAAQEHVKIGLVIHGATAIKNLKKQQAVYARTAAKKAARQLIAA